MNKRTASGVTDGRPDHSITQQPTSQQWRLKSLIVLGLTLTLLAVLRAAPMTFTVTNTADSGAGSLRQAILDANANAGSTIAFNIPGGGVQTITPVQALPAITASTLIDGSTQPGYVAGGAPVIVIDGSNATGADGLTVTNSATIRALTINHFSGGHDGIFLNGATVSVIEGCYIGTDASGTAAAANDTGVFVSGGSSTNTIGGTTAAARNIISGNTGGGVTIQDASNTTIAGNIIGLNAAGTAAMGNAVAVGLRDGASNNIIGGTTVGARNILSGNAYYGIDVFNNSNGNSVQGNYIGVDKNGTAALPNGDGGVYLNSCLSNVVGGTAPGAGNLISGNGPGAGGTGTSGSGVAIDTNGGSPFAAGNIVQGNFIGTNAAGTAALPNTNGIAIFNAQNNIIGGSAAGQSNLIAFNSGSGVLVQSAASTGNSIRGNSIHDNTQLGINLAGGTEDANGVTANDPLDPDTGPNNLQNYPVITNVVASANSTVSGTLNSLANTTFSIDLYFNDAADPSGFGEGQTYLGTSSVTTDSSGNANFAFTATGVNLSGKYVTATATDTGGNTSEFSRTLPGIIVTNTSDSNAAGSGSLRAAITYANANPGTTITFNIPGAGVHTIMPVSGLPNITASTFVDGSSQPGYVVGGAPVIVIDGTNAGAADGLVVTNSATIQALTINNFASGDGIFLNGAAGSVIEGCYIGTNAAGTAAAGNATGVYISNGANNTVGGTATGAGNVISGNLANGIEILNPNATGNTVLGNFIGTNKTGTAAIPNVLDGVKIGPGNVNNTVGGTSASARNIIAGNSQFGVDLIGNGAGTSGSNTVQGNYIGTDVNGMAALANKIGVAISGSNSNTIGGTATGAGNLLSGNTLDGINCGAQSTGNLFQGNKIGTNATGLLPLANGQDGVYLSGSTTNTTVGGTASGAGNLISGNGQFGVTISGTGTNNNLVQGNTIGTNVNGMAALANLIYGVQIMSGAQSNTVGGTVTGARNIISGNRSVGIIIADTGTNSNLVQGNYIGTDKNGAAAIANPTGVLIGGGAQSNTVGGTTATARNIISGNTVGMYIIAANANSVKGNYVGLNAAGDASVPNTNVGISLISASQSNAIGGTGSGDGNVISGNGGDGVGFFGTNTNRNTVQGNFIGTDPAGGAALPNAGAGISLTNGPTSNTIGGAGAGNVLSGNGGAGVIINGAGTNLNLVQGNMIGTDKTGFNKVPNGTDTGTFFRSGLFILNGAQQNTVGGTTAAQRNIISGNAENGIGIFSSGTSSNVVEGNYIGTNVTGKVPLGNGVAGVSIFAQATSNTIGGITAAARNIISGNASDGIFILQTGTSDNLVQGNYIGTDVTGITSVKNSGNGIHVFAGASANTIGGAVNGASNVISGNGINGVVFTDTGTNGNFVQGNFIGTDAKGTAAVPNAIGITINSGAQSNIIGGTAAAQGNTIAYNGTGIVVDDDTAAAGSTSNNPLEGNSIYSNTGLGINLVGGTENSNGVTANDTGDGDTGPNNLQNYPVIHGLAVSGSKAVISGSLNSTANSAFSIDIYRNTTADASGYGEGEVYVGAPATVTTDASGNATFSFTDTNLPTTGSAPYYTATATRLQTSPTTAALDTSEFSAAVAASGATYIVTNTNAVGGGSLHDAIVFANANPGVTIKFNIPGTGTQTISPTAASPLPAITAANTIIDGYTQPGASQNTLTVGDNAVLKIVINGTGSSAGLVINNVAGCVLQGLAINNSTVGIALTGISAINNTVRGCFIGTNAAGNAAVPNTIDGVVLGNGSRNTIGGDVATTPGARNLISGNMGAGIVFQTGAAHNLITGNYIGLNAAGTGALGNSGFGVGLNAASNNQIGGTTAGTRNVISGNGGDGVNIQGVGSSNTVEGNYIGTDNTGKVSLPNLRGVNISSGAQDNIIGGTATGAANIIAFNKGSGVQVGSTATGNTIEQNSIFSNGGLGINLQPAGEATDTVTPNDTGDADTGPNNLQNFPVLSVATSGGQTTIGGTLNSTANTQFTIDYYRNSAADASGYGEGETYLGAQTVTTDAAGNAALNFPVSAPTSGQVFTATAANTVTGDTSEFAQDQSATAAALSLTIATSPATTPPTFNEGDGANAATGTVTRNTPLTSALTVTLTSSKPGKATVPATVTIPAGQNAATFSITAVDNAVADGSQTVTITATAAGLASATANVIVTDNDTPGITVTVPAGGLKTTAAGGTAEFTVKLDSQPTADVTIDVTSSDTQQGTVSPATLTFTPQNYSTPQKVTVTGVNDQSSTTNQTYKVNLAPAVSNDPNYNGLKATPASVTVTNVYTTANANIVVTPTTGLKTTTAGGTATFTVSLKVAPTSSVTIPLTSSNPRAVTVAPAALTFTPQNYSTPQTVTVTGVVSKVAGGNQTYTIKVGPAQSSDAAYQGLSGPDVTVVNLNANTPGFIVTPTKGLVTSQAGKTATFSIRLTSQPTTNVRFGIQSSDTQQGTVKPKALVFTPQDWNKPQTVTVTGVNNHVEGKSVPYHITVTCGSTDPAYNHLPAQTVSVTNQNTDVAGFTLSATAGLTTTAAGGSDSFTIRLKTKPTANVLIPVASSDTTQGIVSPRLLTFTPANWNVPQVVRVTGVDDKLGLGKMPYRILLGPVRSNDGHYNGLIPPAVMVVNLENRSPGFTLTPPTGLTTTNVGGTATFTVKLNSKPQNTVTLTLTSSNPRAGTVAPTALTFTPADWNVPQTVTVTGANADHQADDAPYYITLSPAASADAQYKGLKPVIERLTNLNLSGPPTLTLTPLKTTLLAGQQQQFVATISGLTGVKPGWRVQEDSGGTITKDGLYTAPQFPGTYHIIVTVPGYPDLTATAVVDVVTEASVAFGWGDNSFGEVGNGNTTQQPLPQLVNGLTGAVAVAAGGSHSLALKDGVVYAWGYNGVDGSKGQQITGPVPVAGLPRIEAIAAGWYHDLAVTQDGHVWAWGLNDSGQLGDGTANSSGVPVLVQNLSGVVAVAAGAYHSLALKRDGTLWCWGNNFYGQLGNGSHDNSSVPVQVANLPSVLLSAGAISAGGGHSVAVLANGEARAWGWNYYGQLGTGDSTDRALPTTVLRAAPSTNALSGTAPLANVKSVAAGYAHTLFLLTDKTVSACGNNAYGQLGTSHNSSHIALPVPNLSGVTAVAAGAGHSLALLSDGTVVAWGLNDNGQLGDGTYTSRATPTPVARLQDIKALAAGYKHSLALSNSTTPAATATARLALSSGQANATRNNIALNFSGALDAETASDAAHYAVTVNRQAVAVESAAYNSATHQVLLALPDGTLQPGDRVTVNWSGLRTAKAAPLANGSTTLKAR